MSSKWNHHHKTTSAAPSNVLAWLRYADVQRLTCTSAKVAHVLEQQHAAIIRYLRDIEVLICLQCPLRLQRKLSKALQQQEHYRIMEWEQGAYDRPQTMPTATLYDAFESNWSHRFFGGTVPFLFASVHHLDLEERELEVGEAFDDVDMMGRNDNGDVDEEEDEDHDEDEYDDPPAKRQRPTLLECSSIFCDHESNAVTRVYYVNENPYCGSCLDRDCFLKLRFCNQHYRVHNSEFRAQELLPYNPEDVAHWGLADDEFWARLW